MAMAKIIINKIGDIIISYYKSFIHFLNLIFLFPSPNWIKSVAEHGTFKLKGETLKKIVLGNSTGTMMDLFCHFPSNGEYLLGS